MTTPRRDFLNMLGVGGLSAGTGPLNLSGIDGGGDPYVKSDKWDMSWIKRVHGKGRAVFDMVTTEGSGGWGRVTMWRDQALEVYGGPKEVTAVAVIRHGAIRLAMSDAYWTEFPPSAGRGRGAAPADTTSRPATPPPPPPPSRNPIAVAKAGASAQEKTESLEGFLAGGGIVLACNVAFSFGPRGAVARARGLTGEAGIAEADKIARGLLVPGVILMPSGVFALIAAQQAGCGMLGAAVPSMTGSS